MGGRGAGQGRGGACIAACTWPSGARIIPAASNHGRPAQMRTVGHLGLEADGAGGAARLGEGQALGRLHRVGARVVPGQADQDGCRRRLGGCGGRQRGCQSEVCRKRCAEAAGLAPRLGSGPVACGWPLPAAQPLEKQPQRAAQAGICRRARACKGTAAAGGSGGAVARQARVPRCHALDGPRTIAGLAHWVGPVCAA